LDYFDELTGGYLVTHLQRIDHSLISKNERLKFEKEFGMSMVYARNGFRIEMLEELPRISSPDVLIDGRPGDLKSLSGHNNIARHAKEAVRKQGADIVLFEFGSVTDRVRTELRKLQAVEISGFYYESGECVVYSF
jgi:hypothetical protein